MFITSQDIKVAEYCAERMISFYDSKNWMVGKNKMTQWKGRATIWVKDEIEKSNKNNNGQKQGFSQALDKHLRDNDPNYKNY